MPSYLGGLASLDQWEGLKQWQQRHQDLLGERGMNSKVEVSDKHFHALVTAPDKEQSSPPFMDLLKVAEKDDALLPPPLLKHDLSIIPEADENNRSREEDLDAQRSKQVKNKLIALKSKASNLRNQENTSFQTKLAEENYESLESFASNTKQETYPNHANEGKSVKRPFLRRGQGLVKYNLRPDDLKYPYRKTAIKETAADNQKIVPNPSKFKFKHPGLEKVTNQSLVKNQPIKTSKAAHLTAPMQRLVLSIPSQKANTAEIGTWSQVLGNDLQTSAMPNNENISKETLSLQPPSIPKPFVFQYEPSKMRNAHYSFREAKSSNKPDSSPEEDQESLAAYLDLEQHVGNASFCSTSSKVDRLLAQSSKHSVHQSNPDAITQSKQLSPVKTGRRFFSTAKVENSTSDDCVGMWSSSDLNNLIRARARRSGSLIKQHQEQNESDMSGHSVLKSQALRDASVTCTSEAAPTMVMPKEPLQATLEQQGIDWLLEAVGPSRKPHLMKTMSSIDLDSSFIKKALIPNGNEDDDESDTETDSSSSSSSCEELEKFTSEMNDSSNVTPLKQTSSKTNEAFQNSKDFKMDSHLPFKLISDATLEDINNQIESHLSDLRKEIETLQSSKAKTQKYTASLEKKVQDLEHRLTLEARSFNKRLEEERDAAEKRLSEEQGKLLKEKQALQRTLREERRKAPDPITQQELLNLKQENAKWEEKWRADRAKARGLESNLRIQITNLKRENEKLKEEYSKIKREKETAVNTAKAKSASNTRVINSIAQQLGNNKPKVTVVREENMKLPSQKSSSAYNLRASPQDRDPNLPKPTVTVDSFPKAPHNEWSTDEEIDLGKETSDEDDITDNVELVSKRVTDPKTSVDNFRKIKRNAQELLTLEQERSDLETAQAKYEAMFGKDGTGLNMTEGINNTQITSSLPSGNQDFAAGTLKAEKFVKSIQHPDGKVEQVKENGTRVVTYPDGTWKRHSSSGSVMTVPSCGWPVHILYFNGDQLEKFSDGTTRYFYAKTNVWQKTYPDGHEELIYPNGQMEKRDKGGSVKVILPGVNDKPIGEKRNPDGNCVTNGMTVEKLPNGDTIILLPNGESELHTHEYMKKEFLDGTVKFLFKDGSQETRYPSGRIRVKDARGNLIKDTSISS